MLGPSFPLRQVSDDVLHEVNPDREKRPLEWHRDFNIINLVISNPRVHGTYQLNQLALFSRYRDPARSEPQVLAGDGFRLCIQGTVNRLERGDTFIHTKPSSEDDETLFDTFPAQGALQVEISACEPEEGGAVFGSGTYPGTLLAWDPELERDTITLDLRAPALALKDVADAIQSGKAAALILQVGVRVFTYEVDDALREPHHQQTFVFHGHAAPAAILKLRTLPVAPSLKPDDEPAYDPFQETSAQSNPTSSPLPPTLTSLSTPLWVIAGLLLLIFLIR